MAKSGIQGAYNRPFLVTTNSEHARPVAEKAELIEVEQPAASGLIEIVIGPMMVRVPRAFDPAELQRVLEAVDVLCLASTPSSNIDELTPRGWLLQARQP